MTWHSLWVLAGRGLLLFGVAAVLALAWLVPHRGFHLLRRPAGKALGSPALDRLHARAPRLMAFLHRHLVDPRRSWLRLALGFVFAAAAVAWFAVLLRGVLTDGRLVIADQCLHNTVCRFHSVVLWRYYSLVSNIAGPAFVIPFVAALAALFAAGGRRREALGLGLSLAGAIVLAEVFKRLVERPRPPGAAALLHDSSFPSGHTLIGTSVYGLLVYLVLRDDPRRPWHWLVAAPLLFLIGSVPLSRVYLGVHWPYDTVASLALATAWLAILIALFKWPPVEHRLPARATPRPWLPRALVAFGAAAVASGAVLASANPLPKVIEPAAAVSAVPLAALTAAFPPQLPRQSEDAVGGGMEPVSILYLGSADDVSAAFRRAGWQQADPQSVHGVLHELWDVITNRPDPRGPATPTYYRRQPQDLTFEKPGDVTGSIRRRHHTRLWDTGLRATPGAAPLWVSTASYDAGVKLVAAPYLLTHRIDLHVDKERDVIAHDLTATGARNLATVKVTGPMQGHNAAQDHFVTDGRAYLLAIP